VEAILAGMSDLLQLSEHYAAHGGIHSAGLSDGHRLLLHAEDLGRHNTLDRIAGLALRQEVPTPGKLLLTSGRISSEMAIKASRLGVVALASRTSPTDLAVQVCRHCHIGLAGYARGGAMEVYTHAEVFGL
jgi:FdhD protein